MKLSNILILLCLTSVLFACGGAEERKAAYLEKAKYSMKIEDYEKARIELKNVLQIDPKYADAYFLLGRVYENQKNYPKAFANFNKASDLDPGNLEVQARLGRFYLLMSDGMEKAKEKIDLILTKDSDNEEGLILKAGYLVKQNKNEDAKSIYQGIFERNPGNAENAIYLATSHFNNKEFDRAIEVLNKCIELSPDEQRLYTALARIYFVKKDYVSAENTLKGILEKNQDVYSNYVKLAKFYESIDRKDQANSTYLQAINKDPDDERRKLIYVDYIRSTEGASAAISQLHDYINSEPESYVYHLALGVIYEIDNNMEMATETYDSVISKDTDEKTELQARIKLANVYFKRGELEKSESIIDGALTLSPNDPEVNLIKAKLLMLGNNLEQAIISLRTVIKSEPGNINAYIFLASSHQRNNENEQAKDVLSRAYDNNRTNKNALLVLSQYYAKSKDILMAEKMVDDYLAIDDSNYDALNLKGNLLLFNKRNSDAKTNAQKILKLHPGKDAGYLQSAVISLAENDKNGAIKILKDGYKKANSKTIIQSLVKMQVSMKSYDEPIELLNNELKDNTNRPELYWMLAGVYLASGDEASAINNFNKIIDMRPDYNKAYVALSTLHMSKNNKVKAISILRKGLDNTNYDIEIAQTLASVLEKEKRYASAIEIYEKIIGKDDKNLIAINNLISLISLHSDDEESLARAVALVDKLKHLTHPAVLDTVGWLHYKTGNYSDAEVALKMAAESEPKNPIFNYHLGMAYYKMNDKALAKKHLSLALDTKIKYYGRKEAEELLKTL